MTAVHQLVPVFADGDAIGGSVRQIRQWLRQAGFTSRVYAETYNPAPSRDVRPAAALLEDVTAADVVLYHLSIGSHCATTFARVPGKRVLVYHNVTPPHFYAAASSRVRYWLERGMGDVQTLASTVDLCIACSEFNEVDLRAAGATNTVVIPPPVDLTRLRPRPAVAPPFPTLLFVGRFAPNKRQDHLVRTLAALRATGLSNSRLIMTGSGSDTGAYVSAIKGLIERLQLGDAVSIPPQPLSDADLGDLYARASVFVGASEHEGFCVPLVEAMAFGVPIIGRDAGAVAATLGGAGLLLRGDDPLVWAEATVRVIRDEGLRGRLIAAGRDRSRAFSPDVVRNQYFDALRALGVPCSSDVRS